jgi:Carboxypeptidase regulatory-like domain/TonB dependent receptor
MKRFCVFALALTASLLMGLAVSAQQGIPLSGNVQDQDGAVIPGAKVTLTNSTTGEVRDAAADDGGNFSFENVAPGKYLLKGKAKGFESTELEITIGAEAPAPIKLKLGISLQEEVTITDNQAEKTISPQANADAIDMTSDFLKTLPAQSDDILPIVGNFLSTSAQGTEGLAVVVDGVEGTALNVPTDAIRRVIINRNPYSSSFRRPGEGRVEVITKDGSRRRYDGTFSYMVRNAFFDARDTFTRRLALPNPNLDRRLFSASFGGPVPKQKKATFFFSANDLWNSQDVGINAITTAGPLIENVPTTKHRLNLLTRVDLRLNDVHTLSSRFYYYRIPETNKGLGIPLVLAEQGYDSFSGGKRFMFSDRAILSATLLNELSVNFSMDYYRDGKKPASPMLVVRGAFVGGPSQVNNTGSEKALDVQDNVTYTRGNHTIRFGGGLRTRFNNSVNATNFVGTYFFQGLQEFIDRSPSGFQGYQGDSTASFSQYEASGFIEDEIKLRRWFSITPGLRYDWYSSIKDRNNFGPRLSFALAPGKQKTVLRGGAGLFYERLSGSVIQQTFIDGSRKNLVDISNPSYPTPFVAGSTRPRPKPTVWKLAPDLAAPYMIMGSLSLERRLWGRSQVSVEYHRLHGVHLYRAHDINAPLDQFGPQFIGMRPNPNFLKINQVESSASSRSSALKVTFQGRIGKVFRGMAQYTYSRTTDDTDGPLVLPENNYELGRELGRSNFDQRHRFSYAGTFDLPFAFRLGSVLSLAAGTPFDITTGFDDNGDRTYRDRPLGVTRNTGLGPPIAQLDLRLTKLLRFPTPFNHKSGKSDRKLKNVEFSIDAFNVFNRPNSPVIVGELGAHYFGQATTTNMARTLQVSVKYSF